MPATLRTTVCSTANTAITLLCSFDVGRIALGSEEPCFVEGLVVSWDTEEKKKKKKKMKNSAHHSPIHL